MTKEFCWERLIQAKERIIVELDPDTKALMEEILILKELEDQD